MQGSNQESRIKLGSDLPSELGSELRSHPESETSYMGACIKT